MEVPFVTWCYGLLCCRIGRHGLFVIQHDGWNTARCRLLAQALLLTDLYLLRAHHTHGPSRAIQPSRPSPHPSSDWPLLLSSPSGPKLPRRRRLERQEGAGARQWRDKRREWEGRVLRGQVWKVWQNLASQGIDVGCDSRRLDRPIRRSRSCEFRLFCKKALNLPRNQHAVRPPLLDNFSKKFTNFPKSTRSPTFLV